MVHICINKLTIFGSDNGLSPGRCHAIIWTNAGILLTEPLRTKCGEILFENSYIFIQENAFENVCEMVDILSRPQCVNQMGMHSNMERTHKGNEFIPNFDITIGWRQMSIKISPFACFLIVYSAVCSGWHKNKTKASHHWPFVRGIHWWLVDDGFPSQRAFPWQDIIIYYLIGKFEWNFMYFIFQIIFVIDGWVISCELALRSTLLMISQHWFR